MMSFFRKIKAGLFSSGALTFFMLLAFISATVGITRAGITAVDEVGGEGEACYPNSSCEPGLTCFDIQDSHTCLRDAKPVFSGTARQCYSYSDKEKQEHTPCFETETECLVSFSRKMQDISNDILNGCSFIKE